MRNMRGRWWSISIGVVVIMVAGFAVVSVNATEAHTPGARVVQVHVPKEDRFTPFAVQIRTGDTVQWVNDDTDDHSVRRDDAMSTVGTTGMDQLLPGTDSNNGNPGTFSMRFSHPGTFVYFCRFHAKLDAFNQPIAPGPRGGIADERGNFGTPMMGVITVLPKENSR